MSTLNKTYIKFMSTYIKFKLIYIKFTPRQLNHLFYKVYVYIE